MRTNKWIGGWVLTGIHQYSTGIPIVLSANNTLPLFTSILRPDVVTDVAATIGNRELRSGDRPVDQSRPPSGFRQPALRNFRTIVHRSAQPIVP